jgi:hypothetical protein
MFTEPHIYDDNYMQAEVVLANSKEEALEILRREDKWNIEELKRIEPKTVVLDQPCVVSTLIYFG